MALRGVAPFLFPVGTIDGRSSPGLCIATDSAGNRVYVPDNRRPSLYTQSFGDCQGNSLINVTRFDGAYYRDNMTVTFNLEGHTSVKNDTVMRELTVAPLDVSRGH